MKFRIRGDSLRLRLKRSEVDQLSAGVGIVEETHFPGSVLTYRLDVSDSSDFSARFDDATVFIGLPRSKVLHWANTDEVSLFAEQELSGSDPLTLLIEKDFSCLEPGNHRDCDDDDDTFPHPAAQAGGS